MTNFFVIIFLVLVFFMSFFYVFYVINSIIFFGIIFFYYYFVFVFSYIMPAFLSSVKNLTQENVMSFIRYNTGLILLRYVRVGGLFLNPILCHVKKAPYRIGAKSKP
jgi:hypothetical protein